MITDKKLHMLAKELLSLSKEIENQFDSSTKRSLLSPSLFHGKLQDEIARADRYQYPFALCLIRPDKIPYEANGQLVADNLFNLVADEIYCFIRNLDYLGRHKKHGLALLLPMTSKAGAVKVGKRLCKELADIWEINQMSEDNRAVLTEEELDFLLREKCNIREEDKPPLLTISIGAAIYPDDTRDKANLYRMAGELLDKAQKKGGDRIEIAPSRNTSASLIPQTVETLLAVESLLINMGENGKITQKEKKAFVDLQERFNSFLLHVKNKTYGRTILTNSEYNIFERLVKQWLNGERRGVSRDRRRRVMSIDMEKRKTKRRRLQNTKNN